MFKAKVLAQVSQSTPGSNGPQWDTFPRSEPVDWVSQSLQDLKSYDHGLPSGKSALVSLLLLVLVMYACMPQVPKVPTNKSTSNGMNAINGINVRTNGRTSPPPRLFLHSPIFS